MVVMTIQTPNTLGMTNTDEAAPDASASGWITTTPGLIDLRYFLGTPDQKSTYPESYITQVESFADLFKTLYEYSLENLGIDPDTSYNDFIKTIIPQPYSLPKDLTWWESFGDGFFKALGELVDYLDYYNHRRSKTKLKGLPPVIHRLQALLVT